MSEISITEDADEMPKVLWTTVTTDSEFARATRDPGLHLVEVFNSEFGVCVPMRKPLQAFKLEEIPDDRFTLVEAVADSIPFLKRMKKTSEPIWMLIGTRILITIMFGVNPVALFAKIKEEWANELQVIYGTFERTKKSYCLAPEEDQHKEWLDVMRLQREQEAEYKAIVRAHKYTVKMAKVEEILKDQTLVVLFTGLEPDVENAALNLLRKHYEGLQMVEESVETITVNEETFRKIFCNSAFVIPEQLKESIIQITVVNLKYCPHVPCEAHHEMEDLLDEGEIENRLACLVYGIHDNGRINVNKPRLSSIIGQTYTVQTLESSSSSSSSSSSLSNSSSLKKLSPKLQSRPSVINLPSLWTPEDVPAKCAAIMALYGDKLKLDYKLNLIKPPPPMTIIVFNAPRTGGIELMLKGKPHKVYKYAYFTAGHPARKPRLVARDWAYMKQFDKHKMAATKLVVGLLELEEDKIAEYLLINPVHVTDPDTGSQWAEIFFPPEFSKWMEEIPMDLRSALSNQEDEDGIMSEDEI